MLDIKIINAKIIDGTGAPAFDGEVGIVGDKITKIGDLSNEEAKDGKGGYVRMFASRGSIPYYAPRDGSGYVSHALGKINYGNTRYVQTKNPKRNSNLAGLPNRDVLVTICYKNQNSSK